MLPRQEQPDEACTGVLASRQDATTTTPAIKAHRASEPIMPLMMPSIGLLRRSGGMAWEWITTLSYLSVISRLYRGLSGFRYGYSTHRSAHGSRRFAYAMIAQRAMQPPIGASVARERDAPYLGP
jgi:hypothetical protein